MVTRRLLATLLVTCGLTYGVTSTAQQQVAKPKPSVSAPAIDSSLIDPLPIPTVTKPTVKPKASASIKPSAVPTSIAPPVTPPPPPATSVPIPAAPIPAAPIPAAPPLAAASTASMPMLTAPSVHHAPIAIAKPHEILDVEVELNNPHLAKRVLLVYQHGATTEELPFLRAGEGYVARVPADHVAPPLLSYAIEVETLDGRRVAAFATRTALHPVQIPDDLEDERERILLARVGNRRSVTSASFDYVYYGKSAGDNEPNGRQGIPVRDEYLRAEASYLYRPLRYVVEFGVRIGLVRGHSPVGAFDGTKVGLNYASPTATFRVHELFHVEGWLLTSVTQVGFSTGAGLAFHIGDPFGSKLVLGGETIKTFGNRAWARLDIMRGIVRVSPVVEVGDIPNARPGVRLYTELGFHLPDGFQVAIRGGYQARDFNSGGPGGGLAISYAF